MTPMFHLFVSVSLDSQQFLLPFFASVSDTAEELVFPKAGLHAAQGIASNGHHKMTIWLWFNFTKNGWFMMV